MSQSKRKLCVVTGTRAEYGLLKHLMSAISNSLDFELQIIATGMHLSTQYGNTYKEIEADGFTISCKVDSLLSGDRPKDISHATATSLIGISKAYEQLKPDLIIVLGDRFEILAAVLAAHFARIPIAHLHGGELTQGSMDDAIRHAITKYAHLHFVAAEEYRKRVIQLGEQPDRVFCVGGLGVDAIATVKLLTREELEHDLGFIFKNKNLLITFHSATIEDNTSAKQMEELLAALHELCDTQLIFTLPNADVDSDIISLMIKVFVANHSNACYCTSLGQLRYLSCVAQVDAVVGNSSSGLTEVPTFKKATVNIGTRQQGRLQAASVLNCEPYRAHILKSLSAVYSPLFQTQLSNVVNPYGLGGAVERIMLILKQTSFKQLINKTFYDV